MSNWAVLNNNIVINTIVADSKDIAETATGFECIEYTFADIVNVGYTWDGDTFIPPVTE